MGQIFELTKHQNQALEVTFDWLFSKSRSPFLVISGYAGTGKTSFISYFRRELAPQKTWKDKKVAFATYTGKAASVLRQKLVENNAIQVGDSCSTIHSLIYKAITDKTGQIVCFERTPALIHDLIVIDEGSMLNETIWKDLLSYKVPILVVGDHGQLPPIEGRFNLMEQANFRLEQIVRQASDNPIIQLSEKIRKGEGIPYNSRPGSIRKFSLNDPESEEYFSEAITSADNDYLCICARNKTRQVLNQKIRHLLGFTETEPMKNERLICLKNNHAAGIYNGMLGQIIKINETDKHWYKLRVNFDEQGAPFAGLCLKYQFGLEKTLREPLPANFPLNETQFENLFDFGYALTAHKAQGSEAKRVVLFEERMYRSTDDDWQRWLYTAVTRAREELVIFA